jgi:hypothetical protein
MTLQLTARTLFTALFVSFILHNIEEAIVICSYPVQSPVSFIEPESCRQFLWAVSLLTMIVIVFFVAAVLTKKQTVYLLISTAIASGLVLNVLIPHLVVALYTFNYTPGLVTGVVLNLPLGLITLSKNRSRCKSRKQFYLYIIMGLIAGYLLFAGIMILALHFIQ